MKIPNFFKQESAQAFLLTAGGLWLFWKEGAPDSLLYMVTGLGGVFIVAEKWRSGRMGKKSLLSE